MAEQEPLEFLQTFSQRPSTNSKKVTPAQEAYLKKVDERVQNPEYQKIDPLQRYNLILFIVHLMITIFLFLYFRKIQNQNNPVRGIDLDLYEHVFNINTELNFAEVVSQKVRTISEGGVTSLVLTFFAITAGFHLLYYFNPGGIYLNAVKKGNNFLRWIEYTISATIMVILIALLSGVKDVNNYILIVVASIAIMSTGQMFETAGSDPYKRWLPIIIGFLLLMGVFTVVFRNFRKRLEETQKAGVELPKWLFGVVYVMFAFYASFGFVPVAQMIFKGNYRKYEFAYLTLSLVSKASLGLLIAIGFGQRSQAQ